MFRAVRAMALIQDRDYVIPDDVKDLAYAVLARNMPRDARGEAPKNTSS